MTQKKHPDLLPIRPFIKRVIRHLLIGFTIILISLLIGMFGYKHYGEMSWISSYENAAMILSGMGPVDTMPTQKGKLFAGTYALFSGIVFLVVIVIIIAPLFHRFLHKFLINDTR